MHLATYTASRANLGDIFLPRSIRFYGVAAPASSFSFGQQSLSSPRHQTTVRSVFRQVTERGLFADGVVFGFVSWPTEYIYSVRRSILRYVGWGREASFSVYI